MRLERSSSDRGVARFCCVLGEYLSEEAFWMQINQESLMRSSAPAMVGGRCQDDHHQGRVVELFSSEGSSLSEEVMVENWGNLQPHERLGSKVCGGPDDDGHLSQLQPSARGGRHLPTWGLQGDRVEPVLHQVLPMEVIYKQF